MVIKVFQKIVLKMMKYIFWKIVIVQDMYRKNLINNAELINNVEFLRFISIA